jgi:hypothetical protein
MRTFGRSLVLSALLVSIAPFSRAADSVQFQILSIAPLPDHSVALVRGTLSGSYTRPWDALPAPANYKVPVWFAYPLNVQAFNRTALLEPMHPGGGNDFLMALSRHTQEFNTTIPDPDAGFAELDLVRLLDGAEVLWRPGNVFVGGHFAYATVVAERQLLNLYKQPAFQNGAFHGVIQGIKIDSTFNIPRNFDRLIVDRDVSRMLQDPAAIRGALEQFTAANAAESKLRQRMLQVCSGANGCAAQRVIAGGFSAQSMPWRDMQFMSLNTGFASTAYADGFVFPRTVVDGLILGGVRDPGCNDYFRLPGDPFHLCRGAPPPAEGKTFVINTEDDVQYQLRFPIFDAEEGPQFLGGFLVRGVEGTNDDRNYRTYEIAAATHGSTVSFDPIAAGFTSYPDAPYPNWVDTRPVYRQMLINMRHWLQHDIAPPPNALLALGNVETHELEPAFPFPPPPDPPEVVFGGPQAVWVPTAWRAPNFDRASQYDFNIEGGVRLPHVRTTVNIAGLIKTSFGAPLGIHRPFACHNFAPLTQPFACPWFAENQFPDYPPGFLYGDFIPYRDLDPAHPQLQLELNAFGLTSPCALYYPSRAAYELAVRRAAAYAALQRWVPLDGVDEMVHDAIARADRFAGCVPAH